MENFKLVKTENVSINRSIRISKSLMDKLTTISSVTGLSINKIVNKCVEYALQNMSKK